MSKNVLTPYQVLTASQVRIIMTSSRQYLYEQRVVAGTSASNQMGQAIHEEISKSFKT
jgi:hypothetical protein